MGSSETITRRAKADKRRVKKQALITAPVGTNTVLIQRLLHDADISSFAVDELGAAGQSWRDYVEEAIDRADMIIVVLPDEVSHENVMIELGFALARKKPILIIAGPDMKLPGIASRVPYLRTDLHNEDGLRFGLAQFIAAPRSHAEPASPKPKQTRPIGKHADELLARFHNLREKHGEADLEMLVVEAITTSGIPTLSAKNRESDTGVDIAIWSDDSSRG